MATLIFDESDRLDFLMKLMADEAAKSVMNGKPNYYMDAIEDALYTARKPSVLAPSSYKSYLTDIYGDQQVTYSTEDLDDGEKNKRRLVYAASFKGKFSMFVKEVLAGQPSSSYIPAAYVDSDDPYDLVTVRLSWNQYITLPGTFVSNIKSLETIGRTVAIFKVDRKVFDQSRLLIAIKSQYQHAVDNGIKGVPDEYLPYGKVRVEDGAGEWS